MFYFVLHDWEPWARCRYMLHGPYDIYRMYTKEGCIVSHTVLLSNLLAPPLLPSLVQHCSTDSASVLDKCSSSSYGEVTGWEDRVRLPWNTTLSVNGISSTSCPSARYGNIQEWSKVGRGLSHMTNTTDARRCAYACTSSNFWQQNTTLNITAL